MFCAISFWRRARLEGGNSAGGRQLSSTRTGHGQGCAERAAARRVAAALHISSTAAENGSISALSSMAQPKEISQGVSRMFFELAGQPRSRRWRGLARGVRGRQRQRGLGLGASGVWTAHLLAAPWWHSPRAPSPLRA